MIQTFKITGTICHRVPILIRNISGRRQTISLLRLSINMRNLFPAVHQRRGTLWARPIKPEFPELPVQNQMERNISKPLFRKFRSTSRGCPFFRKLGIPEIFCFICHSIIKSICPTARAGSWLAILHKNANICCSGATEWSPTWISHRYATSLDNSFAEKFARQFPCHPKMIFKLMSSRQIPWKQWPQNNLVYGLIFFSCKQLTAANTTMSSSLSSKISLVNAKSSTNLNSETNKNNCIAAILNLSRKFGPRGHGTRPVQPSRNCRSI